MIKKRNVALCILFSFLTCGIYSWYWMVQLADDVNKVANDDGTTPGLVLLFSLLTCGIYEMVWFYKSGDRLDKARVANGEPAGHLGILWLLLALISCGLISFALMQSELNEYAD